MKILVEDMVKEYYKGDRRRAAAAANITVAFLNNMISQKRAVYRLDNGDWILHTERAKIFSRPDKE